MRNRIVTAVKQRFSIRKLSIGAASVLLGTSLYFMGPSAPVVHAATTGAPAATTGAPVVHAATEKDNDPVDVAEDSTKNDADPVVVAGDSTKNDADVNNAIDKYAQGKQEKLQGDHAPLIRPSDTQSVTVDTPGDRAYQVGKIKDKIDSDIEQANKDNESIEKYKNDHPETLKNGEDSDFFKNQGLSVGDEKNSEINQISVDNKNTTLLKGQSENIGGIDITHTSIMKHKETNTMKVNSNNKLIVDFQNNQSLGKKITVTYDNLKNSYYLENINDETNRIKISRIDRTFSIQEVDNPKLFQPNGKDVYKNDDIYDKCDGPQLIIYNDPSDGFFYNNITQISVKDIYYDDKGSPINFDTKNDKNKAWIFVTSLNSNGGGNVEKVRAQGLNNSPVNAEEIKGSTVTVTNHNDGWWYSDKNNWFGKNLDWDNNAEDNRFGFVGTVAFQYHPGMTLQYRADDKQWGSHWASMQTQVVSSLNQRVIIYNHIKDNTENVIGNDTVTRTIHYLYDNGNTAQPDKTQTVSFNETGTKDDVTGKITWSNDDAQTVNSVITPSITGYTPDKDKVEEQAFKFGDKDVEVTVTYHANAQIAKITYIDDTTKNNLDSQAAIGKFGQAITFATAPAAEIENYKKQGYVFVSNNFDNQTYQAVDSNNVFEVHFKHGTTTVTPGNPGKPGDPVDPKNPDDPHKYPANYTPETLTKTITRDVTYVYADGSQADTPVHQEVIFKGNGVLDLVTGNLVTVDQDGKITSQNGKITWDKESKDYEAVKGIDHTGYSISGIKQINSTATVDSKTGAVGTESVTPTSPNIKIVIPLIKNPDVPVAAAGSIDYIDDTTGSHIESKSFAGNVGAKINYTTAGSIKKWEAKGYDLVSNNFKDGDEVFTKGENTFEVHFKHGTTTVTPGNPGKPGDPVDPKNPDDPHKYPANYTPETLTKTITRDVTYVYADGSQADTPVHQEVIFKGNGVLDLVTGNLVTVDQDGKITSQNGKITWDKESKDYEAVKGIDHTGYSISGIKQINSTATVDSKTGAVGTESVTPTSPNIKIVIPLIKNPDVPVAAAGSIDYIDDTTGSHIESKSFAGNVGAKINYTTAGSIKKWEAKGYDLVSNNFKDGDEVFTKGENTFEVHFKHGTITVTPGNPGKPGDPVDPKNPDDPHKYPANYTPETLTKTITRDVTYVYADGSQADTPVHQEVIFKGNGVLDLVTGNLVTVDQDGKITSQNGKITWDKESKDYEAVKGIDHTGYSISGIKQINSTATVDSKTGAVGTESVTPTSPNIKIVIPLIKNPDVPVAAAGSIDYIDDTTGSHIESKSFAGNVGAKINYTTAGSIKKWEAKGYDLVSNNFKDGDEVFTKGENTFEVHFKHGTTTVTPGNPGKPGDPVDPKNPDDPHKYPANYTPETLTKTITRDVTYVYADGSQADTPVHQEVIFKGNGVLDLVTGNLVTVDQDGKITSQNGKITWDKESKDYEAVKGIDHTGYSISGIKQINSTATVDSKTGAVGTESVTPTSPNIKIVIPLIKNPDVPVAAAGSIDYIDDTTGSHIESKSFAGNVGAKINYTTAGSIKKWEAKGYDLVSNNFKDGDEVFTKGENTFEVHFKHGTITVTPDNPGDPNEPINPNDPDPKSPKYPEGTTKNDLTKDSTQTIIYHYSDGSKPDEKKTETHEDTFTRTKVVDKVTGEVITTTPWTGSHTFDSKDVPVVNGYHSDKKTVGGKTATVNNPDVTDTVTYTPNGKIIPVDPSGNPIPNVPNPTYPTDPNDPTKVVPNEPVPDVPGRTPEVSTVTPEDPSQDTPVVYNPIPNVPGPSVGPSDNTPTPVTPTPGKTTEEKKPDENKDDKDVDEPDDDEDVVPTPRHHKKHNGGESSTTRPRPKGYTPAPRGSSYLDANGKVHYKLPQTGESDSEEMAAVLGGAAATIGLIGLAGAKKRRHE